MYNERNCTKPSHTNTQCFAEVRVGENLRRCKKNTMGLSKYCNTHLKRVGPIERFVTRAMIQHDGVPAYYSGPISSSSGLPHGPGLMSTNNFAWMGSWRNGKMQGHFKVQSRNRSKLPNRVEYYRHGRLEPIRRYTRNELMAVTNNPHIKQKINNTFPNVPLSMMTTLVREIEKAKFKKIMEKDMEKQFKAYRKNQNLGASLLAKHRKNSYNKTVKANKGMRSVI